MTSVLKLSTIHSLESSIKSLISIDSLSIVSLYLLFIESFPIEKNQLGNFYPPDSIFIDISLLEGLNDGAIRSGVGEMLHYFLVSSEENFILFQDNYQKSLSLDVKSLELLINQSLRIKKGFIEADEFDTGERLILNYGHTFGHAIEAATNFSIPHGIAVTHGMDMANKLSLDKGYISSDLYHVLRKVFETIWDSRIPNIKNVDNFVSLLKLDKKVVGNQLRLILTKGIGNMFIEKTDVDQFFLRFLDQYIRDNFSGQ